MELGWVLGTHGRDDGQASVVGSRSIWIGSFDVNRGLPRVVLHIHCTFTNVGIGSDLLGISIYGINGRVEGLGAVAHKAVHVTIYLR